MPTSWVRWAMLVEKLTESLGVGKHVNLKLSLAEKISRFVVLTSSSNAEKIAVDGSVFVTLTL